MHTAIVELYSLPDSVRAAAENHNLAFIGDYVTAGQFVVARIVVSSVLSAADVNALPRLNDAQCLAPLTYTLLADFQQFSKVLIRKAVLLGLSKDIIRQYSTLEGHDVFFLVN